MSNRFNRLGGGYKQITLGLSTNISLSGYTKNSTSNPNYAPIYVSGHVVNSDGSLPGSSHTTSDGLWDALPPDILEVQYTWQRALRSGGTPVTIAGATSATYIATDEDVTQPGLSRIRSRIRLRNDVGWSNWSNSEWVNIDGFEFEPILIPSSPRAGETLVIDFGVLPNEYTITFQGEPLNGELDGTIWTSTSPLSGEGSLSISCSAPGYLNFSDVYSVLPFATPSIVTNPMHGGDGVSYGHVRTTTDGQWVSGIPISSYEYRWQRRDAEGAITVIPDVSINSYEITMEDIGYDISPQVRASNASGFGEWASGAWVTTIPPEEIEPTTDPSPLMQGGGFEIDFGMSPSAWGVEVNNEEVEGTMTPSGVWTSVDVLITTDDVNVWAQAPGYADYSGTFIVAPEIVPPIWPEYTIHAWNPVNGANENGAIPDAIGSIPMWAVDENGVIPEWDGNVAQYQALIVDDADISSVLSTSPRTVTFWRYATSLTEWTDFAYYGTPYSRGSWFYTNGFDDLIFYRYMTNEDWEQGLYNDVRDTGGQWHFFAITVNGDDWRSYVDGVPYMGSPVPAVLVEETSALVFGHILRGDATNHNTPVSPGGGFVGQFADIQIHNRHLTGEEIEVMFGEGELA